jgi:hypothetical protein
MTDNHRIVIGDITHGPYKCREAGELARASSDNAVTRAKMGRLARHRGYTITAPVKELVERAERPVTARLPSSSLEAYYDAELFGYGITKSVPPELCPWP